MWSLKCLTAAITLLSVAKANPKIYRFTHVYGDVFIPQDIRVDDDANTVMIAVGDVSRYPGHVSTLNFHDFDTDYVAFKDIRKGICLVAKAPVDEPQESIYAKRITNTTKAFDTKINSDKMNPVVAKSVAGDRIVDFCRDYNMYFMTLVPKDLDKPILESAEGHCHHNCFHCMLWTSCMLYDKLI